MTDRQRTYALAATVFVAAFALYATMLSTGVAIGDEAEAQTVPYILGISHPTGFPAYTLAGWAFSHALPFGTVAWRLNAFTAACTALGTAGVFLLGVAVAGDLAAAMLAAGVFALGGTVWTGALHANAQPLAGTCSIFALLACVLYARSGNVRTLGFACAFCGFGIATHPSSIWLVPAIAVALAWQRTRLTPRVLVVACIAFAAPLLLYAYLPLRSAFVFNHGLDPAAAAPVFSAGSFDWNTNSPQTVTGFLDEVLARNIHAGNQLPRVFDLRTVPAAAQLWYALSTAQYRIWLLLLAVAGVVALVRSDRRALSILVAGSLGGILFAYVYRYDTHLDRYLFVTFAVLAVLATASVRLTIPRLPAVARPLAGIALAVLAGLAFVQNRPQPSTFLYSDGEAIIAAVQRDTPDGAIVVAQWNDAAALGYGAFVEHSLGTRTIVSGWPWDYADHYRGWAQERPVRIFASPLATRFWPTQPRLEPRDSSFPGYGVYAVLP